jgi:predicted PurR-regulated permease PerM
MSQRFNIRWLALLAICLIAIYLCWLIIYPFLDVIIWSVVLAVVTFPIYERMVKRFPTPPWLASVLTVLLVLAVVVVPIALLTLSAVSQVDDGVAAVKTGITKFKEFMAGNSWLAGTIHKYADPYLQNPDAIGDQLKGYASTIAGRGINVAGQVFGVIIKFAFTLFALFYLLRDADKIGRAAINLLPLEEAQSRQVFRRCREVIKASVQGVMVIAAVQALIGGISFAAVGIPSSVLWGCVMFIAALVPAVGAAIVWVPAAVILALSGSYWSAGIIVFVGGVIVSSIDNVLRPRLVGEKAGLHDLVIFFSVLGGLQAFGVAGLFVGPVVVALTLAIIEAFRQMNPVATSKPVESKVIVSSDGTALAGPSTVETSLPPVDPTPQTIVTTP